jgi:flagellar biosynthesis protein FliR
MELLYQLDAFHSTLPISYLLQNEIFLGRTINWIHEVLHFSRFWLLFRPFVDAVFYTTAENIVVTDQLKISVSAMLSSAVSFIVYSNDVINFDQSFLLFSETMFIAALTHCLLGNADSVVVEIFVNAIRLSGFTQDYDLLRKSVANPKLAENTLECLLTF